jgi:hypothetical protein
MSYAATIRQLKKEISLRQAAIDAITAAIGSPEAAPVRGPFHVRRAKRPRKVKAIEKKAKRTRPARIADDDILRTLESSVIEAAKLLGVSSQTIYKRRAALSQATEAASRAGGDGHRDHDPFRVE